VEKSAELMEQLRAQQREINELRSRAVRETAMSVLPKAKTLAGVQVLAASIDADSVERLREMIDLVRDGLHQTASSQRGPVAGSVIVLGAVLNNKATLVAAVSPELVKRGLHAGKLVGDIARAIGGSGGGRPEMGQAGGGEASRIQEALDLVEPRVKGSLA